MTGINSYDAKVRREIRRRNHIARDLGTPKYRQQIKQGRPKQPPPEIDYELD